MASSIVALPANADWGASQRWLLEAIARGHPLAEVLDALARVIERELPGPLCTILLLEGDRLRSMAGPSLPDAYNDWVDGLPIGPTTGSCGAAAFLGVPVATADIATDPHWEGLREVPLSYGLRASWSMPIPGSDGAVLGTFALYRTEPGMPSEREWAVAADAVHLAGIAIERDLQERRLRQHEAELEQSARRFELLARATNDVVYDWDVATGEIWWNDALYHTFGITRGATEPTIDWWTAQLHPDDEPRVSAGLTAAIEHGAQGWSDEYRFRRGDGSYATVLDRGFVLRDASGAPLRLIGSMMDITERQALEQQLRQAQKMEAIGRLAGGVAHDFNNLLTAILSTAELAMGDLPPDHPVRGDLEEIRRSGERAATLTRQLLAFSRRQVLRAERLDPNDVVHGLERLLRRLLGDASRLELRLDPAAGAVRADRGQLEQVLVNLVVNARDAILDDGTVTVATRRREGPEGALVEISVSDTGVGMDESTRARVFEPFFTTKELGHGTGLGLASVYGIVQQSGGTVEVTSALGVGSTFTVVLPALAGADTDVAGTGAARDAALPDRAPPAGGTETVLVVEDEASVRGIARRMLERAGYTVLEAADGDEALALLERHPGEVALVLSDLVMPRMGGVELAERLRTAAPGAHLLFMSGYDERLRASTRAADREVPVVAKPFAAEELLRAVRRALD